MRVLQISPTFFSGLSQVGGGERYPSELASHLARRTTTTLVSFASERASYTEGALRVEIFPVRRYLRGNRANPFQVGFLRCLRHADVVHVHHYSTLISDLTCLVGSALGKPVFVTDHGGGGDVVLSRVFPVARFYRRAVAQSDFAVRFLQPALQQKVVTIKGGVDLDRFRPAPAGRVENKILYVGRLLPHKGVNYLVDGFRRLGRSDFRLVLVGRVHDTEFVQYLRDQARGMAVEFVHDADDARLLHEYQTARVSLLPSVCMDYRGNYTPIPELMGLALLEAQACGTPAICTDAGAMAEFVDSGRTGFVVEQGSAEAIARALETLIKMDAAEYDSFRQRSREWMEPLSWASVADRHLEEYAEALGPQRRREGALLAV